MAKNIKSDDHEFDNFIKTALQLTASNAPQLTGELIARTAKQLSADASSTSANEPQEAVNAPSTDEPQTSVLSSRKQPGEGTRRRFFFPALVTAACLVLLGGTLLTLSKNGIFPFPSDTEDSAENQSSGLTGISERTETAFEYADDCIDMAGGSEAETSAASSDTTSSDAASSETALTDEACSEDIYNDDTANEEFSFFAAFSNRPATPPDRLVVRTASAETICIRNSRRYNMLCEELDEELYPYDTAVCEDLVLTEKLTDYQKKILLFYEDGKGTYTPGSVLYLYEDVLYVLPKDFSTYDLTTLTPAVAAQKYSIKE